jgi:hypothetical protein
VTVDRGYPQALADVGSGALVQLWRQAQFDKRPISREALHTIARPVSWAAFDAGLSSEELILAVTESWLAMTARGPRADPRLAGLFARLLSLCVEEFHFALRASEARARAIDHLYGRWASSAAKYSP